MGDFISDPLVREAIAALVAALAAWAKWRSARVRRRYAGHSVRVAAGLDADPVTRTSVAAESIMQRFARVSPRDARALALRAAADDGDIPDGTFGS